METLFNKNNLNKIRKIYRKNILKKYGIIDDKLQRCHIFGLREAKYLELVLHLENVDILKDVLTSAKNVCFLSYEQHRQFEKNQYDDLNLNFDDVESKLLELAILIRNTKFRKNDFELASNVYNQLMDINKMN